MVNALRINPADNVAVALADLPAGTPLEWGAPGEALEVVTAEPIPFGHKVAIAAIAAGAHVIKYGASIGRANADIAPGHHVHTHNLRSVRGAVQS
jgi:altronate dehydratase